MKNEKRFWVTVAIVFVAILVWHFTSAIVPALAKGVKALTPFLLAFITAYLLRHPCIWVEKLLSFTTKKKIHKWQHTVATVVVLGLFLGLLGLGIAFLVPNIINNINDIMSNLPSFIGMVIEFARNTVTDLSEKLDEETGLRLMQAISNIGAEALAFVSKGAGNVVATLTDVATKTASFLFDFVLYIVASFMLLHGYENTKRAIKRFMCLFIKETSKYNQACAILHESDIIVEKYIVVRLITSLGIGVVSYVGFLILKLPYSLILALLIALTNLIPYVGPFIGGAPVVVVALATGGWSCAIWACIFMLVIQQIEGNILTPLLTSDALDISPISVLLGVAVFGAMMGIPGMLLGAPIVAIISGIVNRAITLAQQQAEEGEKSEN
ncbi:MAG: AI-2E family transporter [Clostridiales bacterium]|nr:AI-2E family transporter [Clostridiales bacterium]